MTNAADLREMDVEPGPLRLPKQRSLWLDAFGRLAQNPGALIGGAILIALVLVAIFAPYLTSADPFVIVPKERLKPPGAEYWFGTDTFGRDIFTRILYGSRISLQVGIISVGIALVLGVVLGLLAGYNGGFVDGLIMRMIDVMLAFPGILLALVIIAVLGPSLVNVMIAVGLSSVPLYARVTRAAVLEVKSSLFVSAAIVSGCTTPHILFRHILPNILGSIVVVATLGVAGAIISGAALSFLGLGAKSPTPEWGLLLTEGRNYLRQAWWISTFPGLAIMVTVLSINLLGDGLRDALDPRMKK
jgi:peptide/nickel transport system permease protein